MKKSIYYVFSALRIIIDMRSDYSRWELVVKQIVVIDCEVGMDSRKGWLIISAYTPHIPISRSGENDDVSFSHIK